MHRMFLIIIRLARLGACLLLTVTPFQVTFARSLPSGKGSTRDRELHLDIEHISMDVSRHRTGFHVIIRSPMRKRTVAMAEARLVSRK